MRAPDSLVHAAAIAGLAAMACLGKLEPMHAFWGIVAIAALQSPRQRVVELAGALGAFPTSLLRSFRPPPPTTTRPDERERV